MTPVGFANCGFSMALFAVNAATTAAHEDTFDDSLFFVPRGATRTPQAIAQHEVDVSDLVFFNISGRHFQVPREVLSRAPPFSALKFLHGADWFFDARNQEYICDRSPAAFHTVLVYLSTFQLHLPPGMCRNEFETEMRFYGLHNTPMSPCCRVRMTKREKEKRGREPGRQGAMDRLRATARV